MDDTWFHTITSSSTTSRPQIHHKRRASLLEQSTEKEPLTVIGSIDENGDSVEDSWRGPPRATLARRAQSYHDFYSVVKSFERKDTPSTKSELKNLPRKSEETSLYPELTFEDDHAQLESELLKRSHAAYLSYHEQLRCSSAHLDSLVSSTQHTLDLLSTLSTSFKTVETQTDAFRQQCQVLVIEQGRLSSLADDIEENSRYYNFLEPMTRRLNAPGAANLVTGPDFSEMLVNLDRCLAYMEAHLDHRESATYRSRYRLLLTRALTLIRHHVTKTLGEIAADISRRIQGNALKETTHSALLYAKFRVPAPELKTLGLEIQKRAVPTAEDLKAVREPEYLSLMRELYQSYSATRGRLILPLVARKMAELQTNNAQQADIMPFAQAAISYVRGICLDEHDLWFEWFEVDGALYELLENLMEPMYDYLRPRIIHETKLEKLCDLCAMIQARYMGLRAEEDEEEDEEDGDSVVSGVLKGKSTTKSLDFASLVLPALEDAQTRLVFLAVNILRDGIENYRPKPEDLDWPRIDATSSVNGAKTPVLSGKRNVAPSAPKIPEDDPDDGDDRYHEPRSDRNTPMPAAYPTLKKAIWLLRRIYRLVNSVVFDDLAHRIVHSTIHSLLYGRQQVIRVKDKTPQDGQLFLITHLLHLKQQIVAFDIEFIPPEVEFDFSSVTNTFYELRERGNLWNPTSWVKLVGGAVGGGLLPKVVKNMLDAKAELDGRLRTVINEFVTSYATHITAPIDSSAIAQSQGKGSNGAGFDAPKAIRTIRGLAEKDLPPLRAKLAQFVDDARTRETLVAAVRDQVIMTYEEFFDAQSETAGKKVSRKGKGRENEVWDPEIFAEAMERIFQVGQVVGDDIDEDDEMRAEDAL